MAHIAVNTRLLLPGRVEGISRFAYEVLVRMVAEHPEIRFSFFFDRKYDPQFIFGPNVTPYVIPPQARHPVLWYTWFHIMLPQYLNRLKPDVFFSPEFYLTSSTRVPQVGVFHDLAYEHFPKDLAPFASWYCRYYSPRYAEKARKILTVSQFSKQDIIDRYSIPEEKISVVYNGASAHFKPLAEAARQGIRDKYTSGQPFFHFVGGIHPRKNIENLLRAFDVFKEQTNSPVKFLMVGRKAWKYETALAVYEEMEHKEDVIFSGFAEDQDLANIYAASLALVYVPYLEGFGIPLLEAMHSETAIITSNITSMPEVAGDAALLISPYNVDEIAEAMRILYENPDTRLEIIERGRLQRQKFSWDQTYRSVWGSLSELIF